MKRYLKNKSFLTGAILAFIMLGMLVVSLFWLPYDPEEMYLAPKLSLPSISHLMGTDQFGRDVMSRIMKGIQVSFGIGVVVVATGGLVGTLLGACSGYFGGYSNQIKAHDKQCNHNRWHGNVPWCHKKRLLGI